MTMLYQLSVYCELFFFLLFFFQLLSIGVLIISSITLNHVEDKFISSISDTLNEIGKNLIGVDYNQLYQYSVVGSGIIIGLTSALILYEVLVIITRFVNINIINKKINVFVIVVSSYNEILQVLYLLWPIVLLWYVSMTITIMIFMNFYEVSAI